MASDAWNVAMLDELTETPITYGVVKPGLDDPNGVPFVRGGDITGNRVQASQLRCIAPKVSEQYRRTVLRGGEILVSLVGTVGQIAIAPDTLRGANIYRQIAMIRPNSRTIDTRFLRYFLLSTEGQQAIRGRTRGSVQSVINLRDLRTVQVPLPPLSEQKAIANILGTLDDKIELNRRMNATLEAIARALFQSWFVDFDPVRAKMDGRKPIGMDEATAGLFPDGFQESAIGHIPRGWDLGVLDDLVSFVIGGDWGSTEPTEDETVSCHCIRGADIPSLQEGGVGKMPTRFLKSSSVEKRQLVDGDLAIEISGGSPTQCTGRPVLVSEGLLQSLRQPVVASNFCRIVKLKSAVYSKFVYCWLRSLYDAGSLFQFETGTTGIKNFAFAIFSEKYRLAVPAQRIAEAFDVAVSPLFVRIQANASESRTLANLRDSLLPKLLTGELSVAEFRSLEGRSK